MNKNSINGSGLALIVAAGVLIAGLYSAVGAMDAKQAELDQQHYCEMVRLWNLDTWNHVPVDERRGWPDFEENVSCDE